MTRRPASSGPGDLPPGGAPTLAPVSPAPVAYTDAGDGPSVLLLHNGGATRSIWRHQVTDLTRDHRVVAVDLPGFGDSPLPTEGIDLDGYVASISALLDDLELTPTTVIGNCMGAAIAMQLARQRPSDVVGVVLVNPLTDETFRAGWLKPVRWLSNASPRGRALARRATDGLRMPRRLASTALGFQLGRAGRARRLQRDAELIAAYQRPQQLPALLDVLADLPCSYPVADAPRLPAHIPSCVIWGEKNRVLGRHADRVLDRSLGRSRREIVEGAGHLPMLEVPTVVTDLLRDALTEWEVRA